MKRIFTMLIVISSTCTFGQSFINGSFEMTSSVGCDYNNSIIEFNAKMNNVEMFSGWETDIVESGCFTPSIPDGVKAIALAADPSGETGSDAVNLELDVALVSGELYELTFWSYSNPGQPNGDIEIGCAEDWGVMGDIVESVVTTTDTWVEHTVSFTAPNNATHISVRNEQDGIHWNFVDQFSIEAICSPIEITYTTTDETMGSDGAIDITVTGGTPAYTFDWDNDGTGDFDDDEDLTGLEAGTYIVVVEDSEECSGTVTIELGSQVGIDENNIHVSIYPNPTKGDVNIVYNGTFTYTLTTVSGAQLMQGAALNNQLISLENYAAGIYYVKIKVDDQNEVYKIIKQ